MTRCLWGSDPDEPCRRGPLPGFAACDAHLVRPFESFGSRLGAQVGSQSVQADAGERARRGPRSSGRTAHLAAPATTAGLSSR